MLASIVLVAGLLCAQIGGKGVEEAPAPRPAASRIVAVTVYQGQSLVTREVSVPEGAGVVELVVTPLPAATVDGSLAAEGVEGLRVLSTRFRTRAVQQDTRAEVRVKEELIKQLGLEAETVRSEISVQEKDVLYLNKLEGFTATSLDHLTEQGRLDSRAILELSNFVMDRRGARSKAINDLRQRLQANTEATEFARQELTRLAAGANRVERDAVILVQKNRADAATIRLSHLVGSSTWTPQYRLRGANDDAPVRLEYLAAVVQQTGEAWTDARITLSTARPALDAAPPELLPLKMNVAGAASQGPIEANDDRSQRIVAELARPIEMAFAQDTPLDDVLKYVRQSTSGPAFPSGIPIYVNPQGLQDTDKTLASLVTIDLHGIPLRTTLRLLLAQLGLMYRVEDGLLTITSFPQATEPEGVPSWNGHAFGGGGMGGMGGSMAGMGAGLALEQAQASGAARLNRAAADDQAEELRVGDDPAAGGPEGVKDGPSVSFAVAGTLGVPSRPEPQLLEIGRIELPAAYYAQAVPVLTPRVYRLAKLTNQSDLVLLPGEATVSTGTEFVGRLKLPLVAAGEPFVVGFGVDPQLQVSRRLVRKARTIQGGNQVFTYEFRINLRNYRPRAVPVQLWDRLPTPEAEAVVVNLVRTSLDLSTDTIYQRTGRADNLLRWDVDLPAGTTGDKPLSLTYEFRLEYARDLPRPRFLSGGLGEDPIGGGAMGGGMGGMGGGMGGFQSIRPADQ